MPEGSDDYYAHIQEKVMQWLSQKTSIAGLQVSNWMIVLGAVIVALLIYTFMQDAPQTVD